MTNSNTFVHLHTHTEHSLLDGLGRLSAVCTKAAEDGQPAIAMTDHGRLDGVWRWRSAAKAAGIKAIYGIEAYLAIGDRNERNEVHVRREEDDGYGDDDPEQRGKKQSETKVKRYEHLTILATTETGWNNLVAMQNLAQETYWFHPRIDYALLKEYAEGLIVLSGCLAGPIAGPIARGNVAEAEANMRTLIDCVGRDNIYVEIMEHGIPIESDVVLPGLVNLAQTWTDEDGNPDPLPMVVTNDAHFVEGPHCHSHDKEGFEPGSLCPKSNGEYTCTSRDDGDCGAHDAWLAVQSGAFVSQTKRFRFNGTGYNLRTAEVMRGLHADDEYAEVWAEACDNTLVIAERCADDVLESPGMQLPTYPIPDGFKDANAYFKHLIMEGAKRIFGVDADGKLPKAIRERLTMEFKIITSMGFAEYFLIVWDLIAWAQSDRGYPTAEFPDGEPGKKKPLLVGPGRGSAAGSLISYCLGIVDLDPLENDLLFERFMEPGRPEMPDIDLDFEGLRRHEVLEYLALRWGRKNVSRIGSFGQALSRRALKDAARVHERTDIGAKVTKLIDIKGGKPLPFAVLEDPNNRSSEAYRTEVEALTSPVTAVDARNVMAHARAFEGVVNGVGQHACGVLISPRDLTKFVPIRYDRAKGAPVDALGRHTTMITCWDSVNVEDYGLLKLDVLGLQNLDIISAVFSSISRTTGKVMTLKDIPHPATKGDPRIEKAWEILCAGNTAGIFQLESDGITRLTEDVQPHTFEDLSAIIALFRPGPLSAGMHTRYVERKHGREPVDYSIFTKDPAEQKEIATVLDETFGVYVYQEQIMRLGTVMAGFDVKGRAALRKAVSKKKKDEMARVGEMFLKGCVEEQYNEDGSLLSMAYSEETAQVMWDAFKGAADYLFNKSHTAAYAKLSYYTAYLKANWPVDYGAAILSVSDDADKRYAALRSLDDDGIPVLPPDVNISFPWTAAELDPETGEPTGNVRLGLSEIKGVGVSGLHIYMEREANGLFVSLHDLMSRVKAPLEKALPAGFHEQTGLSNKIITTIDEAVDAAVEAKTGPLSDEAMEAFLDSLLLDEAPEPTRKKLNLSAVEGLINAGACDAFGARLGLIRVSRASSELEFDIPTCEWPSVYRSMLQRERLGIAVGEHPLTVEREFLRTWRTPEPARSKFEHLGNKPIPLHKVQKGGVLTMGVIAAWGEFSGSRGRYARFTLEGSKSRIEGQVWSESLSDMADNNAVPSVGDIVAVSGFVKTRIITTVLENDDETADMDSAVAEPVEIQELSATKMWVVNVPYELEEMPANTFAGTVPAPVGGAGRIRASMSASAGLSLEMDHTDEADLNATQRAAVVVSQGDSDPVLPFEDIDPSVDSTIADYSDDDIEEFDFNDTPAKPARAATLGDLEEVDDVVDAVPVAPERDLETPPDFDYEEGRGGSTLTATRPTVAVEQVVETRLVEDFQSTTREAPPTTVFIAAASPFTILNAAIDQRPVNRLSEKPADVFANDATPKEMRGTRMCNVVWHKNIGGQDVYALYLARALTSTKREATGAFAAGFDASRFVEDLEWEEQSHGWRVAPFDASDFAASVSEFMSNSLVGV